MGGLTGAWLVGTGIVVWREVRSSGHMPVPAALLGVTGMFVALSLLADIAPGARKVITVGAWGLDLAGLLKPGMLPFWGQVQQTQSAEAKASAPAPTSAGVVQAL